MAKKRGREGEDPKSDSPGMKRSLCTHCGEVVDVPAGVEHTDCPNCGYSVWWRTCHACGETNSISATVARWHCYACGGENEEEVIASKVGTLFTPQGGVLVPFYFLNSGILGGTTFFPWWVVSSVDFEGETEFRARVTATRMLGIGLFALAAPKRTTVHHTYVTLGLSDETEWTFSLEGHPSSVTTQLRPALAEWERWRPAVESAPEAAGDLPAAPDPIEQLRKLAELHASGVLTDEEFESKKRVLLDKIQ